MFGLLEKALRGVISSGDLTLLSPSGKALRLGDGTGTPVRCRITSPLWAAKILLDPDLYLGEAWMDGGLLVEQGGIHDLLTILARNVLLARRQPAGVKFPYLLRKTLRRLRQINPRGRARRNAAHHYDLDGRLYDLFLDHDRQYSCAYFEHPGQSLTEAQLAKKRHLAAKLLVKPGMRVLDIGCGWGGLALYLARVCGARVVGVTLSKEQWELARKRVRNNGLEDQVDIRLMDYRDLKGPFDRIVSVGMFEHVGVNHYGAFFARLRDLLGADGISVLHSINRADGPGATSAWVERYIFPGGYIPAMSEVLPAVERSGLIVSDVEILRLHYARTLRAWRQRFLSRREEAERLYDARFVRMWEFYLAASEVMFRTGLMNNFQIQMLKDQQAAPLTRDYIHEEEERLRAIDSRLTHLTSIPARARR